MQGITLKNLILQLLLVLLTVTTWLLCQSQVQESGDWERWTYIAGYFLVFLLFLLVKNRFDLEVTQHLKLIFSSSLLLLCCIGLWNYLFHLYGDLFHFDKDIFRGAFESRRAPLYTSVHLFFKFPERYLMLFLLPLLYFILFIRNHRRWNVNWLWMTSVYLLLAIASFAITDGLQERLLANCVHFESFYSDSFLVLHPKSLLSDFTSIMDRMTRSSHYPPGNLMLMLIERNTIPHLTKVVVIFSAVFAIYPMFRIMQLLGMDQKTMNVSVALYAFSTVIPIYTSFSMTPIIIPLGLFLIFYSLKFLTNKGTSSILGSAIFAVIFTFFSFSIVLIGLILLLLMVNALMVKSISINSLFRFAFIFVLTFTFCYLAVYWLTNFNLLECFSHAVRNNTESMSNGFDNLLRYLLRSSGNLIAFFGIIGIPLVAFGFLAFKKAISGSYSALFKNLTISTFTAIFLSGFSGLFFLETERIWMLFIPLICIVAGLALVKKQDHSGIHIIGFTLLLSLLLTIGEELLIDHSCHHFSFGW